MKKILLTLTIIGASVVFLIYPSKKLNKKEMVEQMDSSEVVKSGAEIQMYYFIKKYSKEYNVPEEYAFSLAYQETRYNGIDDTLYRPNRVSSAGALGPMQIMPATAKYIYGKKIPKNELKNNIGLNVEISMKLLRHLYDKYNDWGLVFGAYNTGKPCVNRYAKAILKSKENKDC